MRLNLFVYDEQVAAKDALERLFTNAKFGKKTVSRTYVDVPLALGTGELAAKLVQLLVDGFGVTREETLTFHSYEAI